MADALPHAAIERAWESPAFDVRALFERGMASLRRLAGHGWTDHNLHDPGITILELACFALTENAYRCSWPLEDLLATPGGVVADQFFRCRDVLPNRPLTADDWRRLLIDLPGVRNAWIEADDSAHFHVDLNQGELALERPPHSNWREFRLRGLHRVRIDFMPDRDTDGKRLQTLALVRETLERNRNLCQDFTGISQVREEYFAICGEFELERDAPVAATAAQILTTVANLLAPTVAHYSLEQMRARRDADGHALGVERIFEGPLLQHGFIADEDLAASVLPAEIRLSDLIGAIMDVPGVKYVGELQLQPLDPDTGQSVPVANPWRVPVTPGCLPRLSDVSGRMVFNKRGLAVAAWPLADMPDAVRTLLAASRNAARSKLETPREDDLDVPAGQARTIAGYRSFQRDFPGLYGLGAEGLPERADDQRRIQLLQFKAFLLFFDQVLADQLAVLSSARELLSVSGTDLNQVALRFNDGTPRTLATQLVSSIIDHDRLYLQPDPGTSREETLARHAESPAEATRRRHRVLDHLLARVAEDFAGYAAVMASAFQIEPVRLVADKCRFLAEAPMLGSERALAWFQRPQSSDGIWDSGNVSGLERRLCRLLGIADHTRRNLGAIPQEMYFEDDDTPGDELRFRIRHHSTRKILLSSSTHYATAEAARAEKILAIARGQLSSAYQRLTTVDGRFYFNVVTAEGAVIARRIEYITSADAMEAAISELMTYLRERYSGEGLYVIEHLLLRPTRPGDPLWSPLCLDASCADCSDDPYSHRLHIVLPAQAGRFQDMEFRRFAEETIRQEVPAYLLPTVCWIDAEQMAKLEKAYRDWVELHAGITTHDRTARIKALIDALTQASNVYPQRLLTECMGDDPTPHFILGQTALDSQAAADGPVPE